MTARPVRVFVSFDYDNDLDLKTLFIGQARHSDTPFTVTDHSVKVASVRWKADARSRIRRSDVVVVLCGHHTDRAVGVSEEIKIAREEGVPYFLLCGRATGVCRKPAAARMFDALHGWTWSNISRLLRGRG
jgi:hypothetical protein